MSSKSSLNEFCQKSHLEYPKYVPEKVGDEYVCCVTVDGEEFKSVEAHASKKDAEQDVARVVLNDLLQRHRVTSVQDLLSSVEKDRKLGIGKQLSNNEIRGGVEEGVANLSLQDSASKVQNVSKSPTVAAAVPSESPSTQVSPKPHPPPGFIPQTGQSLAFLSTQPVPSPIIKSSAPFTGPVLTSRPSVQPLHPILTPSPAPLSTVNMATTQDSLIGSSPRKHAQEAQPSSLSAAAPFLRNPASPTISLRPPAPSSSSSPASLKQDGGKHSLLRTHSSPPRPLCVRPLHPLAANFSPVAANFSPQHRNSATFDSFSTPVRPALVPHPPPGSSLGTSNFPATPSNTPYVPFRGILRSPAPYVTGPFNSSFPPRVPVNLIPVNPEYDFVKLLEIYCMRSNSPLPVFSVMENSRRFSASVRVLDFEFRGTRSQETFESAKEHVSLVALACLGIQALGLNDVVRNGPGGVVRDGAGGMSATRSTSNLPLHPIHTSPVGVRSRGTSEDSSNSSSIHSEEPFTKGPSVLASSAPTVVSPPLYKTAPLPTNKEVNSNEKSASVLPEHSPATKLHPPSFFLSSSLSEKAAVPSPHQQSLPQGTVSQSVLDLMALENYKTALNTYCQQNHLTPPIYECTYPEDEVGYIVNIKLEGQNFKSTPQGTKRGAESMAASLALKSFGIAVSVGEDGETSNSTSQGSSSLSSPPQISEAERNVSYKNLLQEYLQKSHSTSLPSYRTERETEGYISCVSIKLPPQGTSRTFRGKPHANKKAAEQESAKKACLELGIVKQ